MIEFGSGMATFITDVLGSVLFNAVSYPRRDIALGMQHAPDLNPIVTFDVENQVWKAIDGPEAQLVDLQDRKTAHGATRWMPRDVIDGGTNCVKKLIRQRKASLYRVPVGRIGDI